MEDSRITELNQRVVEYQKKIETSCDGVIDFLGGLKKTVKRMELEATETRGDLLGMRDTINRRVKQIEEAQKPLEQTLKSIGEMRDVLNANKKISQEFALDMMCLSRLNEEKEVKHITWADETASSSKTDTTSKPIPRSSKERTRQLEEGELAITFDTNLSTNSKDVVSKKSTKTDEKWYDWYAYEDYLKEALQGFLPGSQIPLMDSKMILSFLPDVVCIKFIMGNTIHKGTDRAVCFDPKCESNFVNARMLDQDADVPIKTGQKVEWKVDWGEVMVLNSTENIKLELALGNFVKFTEEFRVVRTTNLDWNRICIGRPFARKYIRARTGPILRGKLHVVKDNRTYHLNYEERQGE